MSKVIGSLIGFALGVAALAGCAAQTSIRSVEYLDERTAATVGALKEPIECVPSFASGEGLRGVGKRISFAYFGPVEWDTAGKYSYALWVHVAAGSDWAAADIRSPQAIALLLDGERMPLVPTDAPTLGRAPYQPIASWGQSAYFELGVKLLARMAESQKIVVDILGADGKNITFVPSADTRGALMEFMRARAITVD